MQLQQDRTYYWRIRAFESAKNDCAERIWSLYCGQVRTGSHRFGQIRTGVKYYFSSTVSCTLSKFGLPPWNPRTGIWRYLARNSMTLRSGGNSPSSRSNWHKVWTGVKCIFSSAQLHELYAVQLSISQVQMCNFTQIGRKTKTYDFW